MAEALRKWSAARQGGYVRVTLGSLTIRDLANATEARTLAADLLRAADEVEPAAVAEPVGERSCFTCRHCRAPAACSPFLAESDEDDPVTAYVIASGTNEAADATADAHENPRPDHCHDDECPDCFGD